MSAVDGSPVIATTERADTIVTFWVDDLLLGIDIRLVQEVLRDQEISPVPLADPTVMGLFNLRGRLAVAIDLRRRLGLLPRPVGEPEVHVVLRTAADPVSLVVDREGDVVTVGAESAEPVPESVSSTMRELLIEAHQRDGYLVLVLDSGLAVSRPVSNRAVAKRAVSIGEVAHAGSGR